MLFRSIGYETGSKAYRMYDPVAKRVHVSRDVVFDEETRWNWEAPGETPASSSFMVEYPVYVTPTATPTPSRSRETTTGSSRDTTPTSGHVDVTPSATKSPARTMTPDKDAKAPSSGSSPVRFVTPPTAQSALFDADDSATAQIGRAHV